MPRFLQISISAVSSSVKLSNPRFQPSRNSSCFARKATCSEGLTKMTFNSLLSPLPQSPWLLLTFETACVVLRFACHHHLRVGQLRRVVLFYNFVEQKLQSFFVVVLIEKFQIRGRVFHRYVNMVLPHGIEPQYFISLELNTR